MIDTAKLRDAATMFDDLADRCTSLNGRTHARVTIILDEDGPAKLRDAAVEIRKTIAVIDQLHDSIARINRMIPVAAPEPDNG